MINKALTPAHHYTECMNDGFWKHYIDLTDENGKPFQVILHHFTKPDEGDPHDHHGKIVSQIISGSYFEETYKIRRDGSVAIGLFLREEGTTNVIESDTVHKIVELPEGECWTIAHYSEKEKKSGFYKFDEDEIRHRFWDQEEYKPFKPEE